MAIHGTSSCYFRGPKAGGRDEGWEADSFKNESWNEGWNEGWPRGAGFLGSEGGRASGQAGHGERKLYIHHTR